MTSRVVRSRDIDAPADQVWAVLGDLSRHGELIPATRMQAPERTTQTGDRVTAVSAGLLIDHMETVTVRATRPGAPWGRWATLRKTGPILLGTADVAVLARYEHTCTAVWAETVLLRGPRLRPVDALVNLALAAMSAWALARLADVAQAPGHGRTPH